jgi:hypothetical protein
VENQTALINMRVLVEMVNPVGVEQRCTTFDAVDLITFFEGIK